MANRDWYQLKARQMVVVREQAEQSPKTLAADAIGRRAPRERSWRVSPRTAKFPSSTTGLAAVRIPDSYYARYRYAVSFRCLGASDKYSSLPWSPRAPFFSLPSPPMSLLDHPERAAVYRTPSLRDAPSWRARVGYTLRTVTHHVSKHVGVGIICSVAYFEP